MKSKKPAKKQETDIQITFGKNFKKTALGQEIIASLAELLKSLELEEEAKQEHKAWAKKRYEEQFG